MEKPTFFIFRIAKDHGSVFTYDLINTNNIIMIHGGDFNSHEACIERINEVIKFGISEINYYKPNNHDNFFTFTLKNNEGVNILSGKYPSKKRRDSNIKTLKQIISEAIIVDKCNLKVKECIFKIKLHAKYTEAEINLLAILINLTFFTFIVSEYFLGGEITIVTMPVFFVIPNIVLLIILYAKGLNLDVNRLFLSKLRQLAYHFDPYDYEVSFRLGFTISVDFAIMIYYVAIFLYYIRDGYYSTVLLSVFLVITINYLLMVILHARYSSELSSPRSDLDNDLASIIENNLKNLKII